ncbi:unnamed protein product [Caenorhabditis sp. 36 PRJEB53466]|nr:unnamed protein product [Caenorhabditis sp. 36 PRJEB53466]
MDNKNIAERIKKLQAQQEHVRIGGKGTPRRKKKVIHKTAAADDKKLQSNLKKLSVTNIPGIEEVNMIKDDGTVIHFNNPKVQTSVPANTFLSPDRLTTSKSPRCSQESLTSSAQSPLPTLRNLPTTSPSSDLTERGMMRMCQNLLVTSMPLLRTRPRPTSSSSSAQQLLALRVMRLARPKFAPLDAFSHDPVDPTGFGQLIASKVSETSKEPRIDLPIGEFLIAPQMFENIYLGETFTFYVNVVNESEKSVVNVVLKCELQTATQRVTLPCSIQDGTIEASKCDGQVISHEVKEIGQHILICSVNYKTLSGENMYFRKFFKFPVSKPIDVKTKFYSAENQDVYLEAQIENTSSLNMFMERVELEPSQHYKVSTISHAEEFEETGALLKPKDIRQFLFCLSPVDVHNTLGYKDLTSIGKLDMSWRTGMGEKGRLQTSALQRIAPGYGDVRLSVEKSPACVTVQKPFEVVCRLYNCSERALDLQLRLEQPSNRQLVFCSPSGVSLGQLAPSGHVDFTFDVFPVSVGIQSISGLRITDTFSKRIYEHDDIAQIFVS